MERIFVKPVEGRRCKDPENYELLPVRGKSVVKNSYWLRRVKDGDCIVADRPSAVVATKKESKVRKRSVAAVVAPVIDNNKTLEV